MGARTSTWPSLLTLLLVTAAPARALAQPHCGGEWERACCYLEHPPGSPSCNAGLVETRQCHGIHVDDVKSGKSEPYFDCACRNGPGYSEGDCINDALTPLPVTRTWIDQQAEARRILSLYVAGFNHDTLDIHQHVRLAGVDDLFEVITGDPELVPENLVIAFSESNPPSDGACDAGEFLAAGPFIDPSPFRKARHAECLANRLQGALGGKKFRVSEWDYVPDEGARGGGPALVTGERWQPVAWERVMVPRIPDHVCAERADGDCAYAFAVRLRGAAPPFNDTQFVVYIVHTEGHYGRQGNIVDPDAEHVCRVPDRKEYTANGDVDAITEWALAHEREGDLPPLLVGDFNSDVFHCLEEGTRQHYTWSNNGVSYTGPNGTESLGTEGEVMHIFAGRPRSEFFPSAFASQVALTPARYLAPVNMRYSMNPDGSASTIRHGVYLPHTAHNVVAMEFVVADTGFSPPNCCGRAGAPQSSTTGPAVMLLPLAGLLKRRLRARRRAPSLQRPS